MTLGALPVTLRNQNESSNNYWLINKDKNIDTSNLKKYIEIGGEIYLRRVYLENIQYLNFKERSI